MIGGGDPPHVTLPIWGPPPPCKQALRLAKQQRCTCDTLFCTLLQDSDVKMLSFTFCGTQENDFLFLFLNFDTITLELNEIEQAR